MRFVIILLSNSSAFNLNDETVIYNFGGECK
jgi:hypothetical protein